MVKHQHKEKRARKSAARKSKNKKKKADSKKKDLNKFLMKEVLNFLKKNKHKSFTVKQIATGTGLWRSVENPKLRSVLDKLTANAHVVYLDKGRYQYTAKATTLSGQIQITRSKIGFLLQEDGEDIFISPKRTGKAFNGDIVKVNMLRRRKKDGRKEGEVVEVLQRHRMDFVGIVREEMPGMFVFEADDPKVGVEFFVRNPLELELKDDLKVLAKFLGWERHSPEVAISQILGEAGTHETEMHAILLQYGFQTAFPEAVEAEAAKIKTTISAAEKRKRRDMRDVATFTIDPTDAKDFDDALSIQWLKNGRIEVGVHIADVSHYVKRGSELDREAFERGTSVYLVDRTIPMLPEKLSNQVCSLRPHEEKLCYSAIFEMDESGKVFDYWIGRTVIFSDHRFDYGGAQDVLDGKEEGPFKEELDTLQKIASALRDMRMKTGSIEFESHEVKFDLDEEGKPIGVRKYEMKDSNHLIEDFMLLANRTVAHHIFKIFENPPLHSVYRIHDRPNLEKLNSLSEFVGHFGYKVNFEEKGNPSEQLNQLLKKVHGTPEQNVIETLAVRSMAKAIYSTKNIGHFGLGFPFYTHFTSPIRRYPDLMIHRLLEAYADKDYKQDPNVLEAQCKHSSDKERTATEAERASIKYKQVEFLEDKVGKAFTGLISGIIESGFFVELDENYCEGFVPVRTMEDDYYVYDESSYSFQGQESGLKLRLGDSVRIEISGTDLQRRTIDMIFLEKLDKASVI